MALRIKSRWRGTKLNDVSPATLRDNASALGFIIWRLSLDGARNLHGEGFDYEGDRERVGVISEYVAFLLHCSDRMVHPRLDDSQRTVFINALAARLADQVQDNLTDIAGPGNYRMPFIDLLNRRMADYAGCGFDGQPRYDLLRYFGAQVLAIMGETQTNRWVIDQVMDIDAPQAFERLRDALANLFDSGHHEPPAAADAGQ